MGWYDIPALWNCAVGAVHTGSFGIYAEVPELHETIDMWAGITFLPLLNCACDAICSDSFDICAKVTELRKHLDIWAGITFLRC